MKLNFSQTSFSAIGTAFTAMQTNLKTLSKDELKTEANSNTTVNDLSQSTNSDKTAIMFNDPISNSLVKINLSSENIDKLQKHFSSDNFYKEDDGSIRLNGEANSFVSGWFGDIAYKREFLSADANKDGRLSDSEYGNTKNNFVGHGEGIGVDEFLLTAQESVDDTYATINSSSGSKIVNYQYQKQKPQSIQDELNTTIGVDSDYNGSMTLKESYQTAKNNAGKNLNKIIEEHAITGLGNKTEPAFKIPTWLVDWDTIFKEQPSEEQAKALQKLKSANGDESVLSDDEKKAIQDQLSAIKKELEKQKDSSSLNNTPENNNSVNVNNTTSDNNINTTKQSDLSSVVSEIKATLTESSSFVDERV